jgi:hydrogenase maturation protein HypF
MTGTLQGIGFRPTVYRLAGRLGLGGSVVNTGDGVQIEIEGLPHQCSRFESELAAALPKPGRIDSVAVSLIPPKGDAEFRIGESRASGRSRTPLPPDAAVCPDCVRELFSPDDRRYLYPFITCTLCGPRFTVVRSFPYDRERTSMAEFSQCPQCEAEYRNPLDRRFHSQTNSCPVCGPRLSLLDAEGRPMEGDPVLKTVELLMSGAVVAIKGIGGFHLACDALNDRAVSTLRARKSREEKPFAVMARDMGVVKELCVIDEVERRLLESPAAPITLLRRRDNTPGTTAASGVPTLGVMLPYAPLHHLLFKHPLIPLGDKPRLLVMTSGNRAEEPIIRKTDEAVRELKGMADAFLTHNRVIELRADDSIFRCIAGRPTAFRRSRGLVPIGYPVKSAPPLSGASSDEFYPEGPVILGAGGDIKNALCVIKGREVMPGPHVGDLASEKAHSYFRRSAEALAAYLEASPELIAADPHPGYFSSQLVGDMGLPVTFVQHHHAHAVSLLFEHDLEGPALFAVFDGTGYGEDGTVWGGEFLLADRVSFTRAGRLSPFLLPGGEAAIRLPLRILAGLLSENGAVPDRYRPLFGGRRTQVPIWIEAAAKGINSPMTSSAGRLFDAAAAAVGFRRETGFEGQAALWLEGIAEPGRPDPYETAIHDGRLIEADSAGLIRAVAEDALAGVPCGRIAARFHASVAHVILGVMRMLSDRNGLKVVGLSGGCFQNKKLTEATEDLLRKEGFRVLLHGDIPPNDGGLAVGQAVSAWTAVTRGARAAFATGSQRKDVSA